MTLHYFAILKKVWLISVIDLLIDCVFVKFAPAVLLVMEKLGGWLHWEKNEYRVVQKVLNRKNTRIMYVDGNKTSHTVFFCDILCYPLSSLIITSSRNFFTYEFWYRWNFFYIWILIRLESSLSTCLSTCLTRWFVIVCLLSNFLSSTLGFNEEKDLTFRFKQI